MTKMSKIKIEARRRARSAHRKVRNTERKLSGLRVEAQLAAIEEQIASLQEQKSALLKKEGLQASDFRLQEEANQASDSGLPTSGKGGLQASDLRKRPTWGFRLEASGRSMVRPDTQLCCPEYRSGRQSCRRTDHARSRT